MMGFFMCTMFGFFCYSYYIGSILIQKNMVEPGTGHKIDIKLIVTTSQATLMGMMTLAQLIPILPGITKALMSAQEVFDVIERVPAIRTPDTGVVNVLSLKEGIKFENVRFRYPTQPEKTRDIFSGINFTIKSGTSTAIVGPSGSGKSTIVQLCNRMYDTLNGNISYDGVNLRNFNLKSLRESVGYVSQEPVLIYGSIKENLLYGNSDATDKDIEEALSLANAQFVHTLDLGLDTFVGVGSMLNLSGG